MADSKHRTFIRKKRFLTDDGPCPEWEKVDIRVDNLTGSSERFLFPEDNFLEDYVITNKEIADKLEKAPELPEKYDEDSFVILVVDPFSSYCYWEISEKTHEKILEEIDSKLMPDFRMVLRLYRLSDRNVQNSIHCFEKDIYDKELVGSTYIDYSASYKLFYGKIGYLTAEEEFYPLVTSLISEEKYMTSHIYEDGLFEMEITRGEPVVRSITPPPIPPPSIDFEDLVTREIKPRMTDNTQSLSFEAEPSQLSVKREVPRVLFNISETREDPVEFFEMPEITDIPAEFFNIPEGREKLLVCHSREKEISFIDRKLFHQPFEEGFIKEFFNVSNKREFFRTDRFESTSDKKELSDFNSIYSFERLKKSGIYREKIYSIKKEVNWEMVELPLKITYFLYDRLTEDIPFPFTGRPSS